jgi:hypothetical protein
MIKLAQSSHGDHRLQGGGINSLIRLRTIIWYSVGAATSVVILAALFDDPAEARIPITPVTGMILWIIWLFMAGIPFAVYGLLSQIIKKVDDRGISHFFPLSSGLLYGLIFAGLASIGDRIDEDYMVPIVLLLPAILGFESLRLACWIRTDRSPAEQGTGGNAI